MKYKFLLAGLLLSICSCKTSATKPIYPNEKVEAVNPDYGILSDTDKTRDGSRPLGWRCFSIKKNKKQNKRETPNVKRFSSCTAWDSRWWPPAL